MNKDLIKKITKLDLNDIACSDTHLRDTLRFLLNAVEQLTAEVQQLSEENQKLKDENNRLKGRARSTHYPPPEKRRKRFFGRGT